MSVNVCLCVCVWGGGGGGGGGGARASVYSDQSNARIYNRELKNDRSLLLESRRERARPRLSWLSIST